MTQTQSDGPPPGQTLADEPVLVVDFGAQYAQLIARRVREAGRYSELVPHDMPVREMLAKSPSAFVLSGGPASVYADGAPRLEEALLDAGVPVLGICYGFQAMAAAMDGEVARTGMREYGQTRARVTDTASTLFDGQPEDQPVWMSHGDAVTQAPSGAKVTATSPGSQVAAFEDDDRRLYGVQWHPEVVHSTFGQRVLENFLRDGAGLRANWTTADVARDLIDRVAAEVGDARLICGLSGGVDSSVAAALVNEAVGEQLTCVFVDHGLLREGEAEQVQQDFVAATGVDLVTVDAEQQFLEALDGVTDPETKRKIIGREFIRVFERAARDIAGSADAQGHPVRYLVQGTLYPDVVESGGGSGAANIKSHHNVGGLPDDLQFSLIEPLRTLFKDEVRHVGLELGVPESIVWRQPFPGPGLAIRIIGAVDAARLDILRRADAVARQELTRAGLDREIWQCPVVLLADVRSVGVQGDGRTYGHPIVLRPVSSEDAMTADWSRLPHEVLALISSRITNEVEEVNRVVLDVTSKPPGTIEWE
ncbi:MAG TPA: glutamine-hydrolyzing GMP synthase [Ornithinimicrobium sp.]|uniref:glutamine-hydrolyzing GMP synthase n=1 Tax=Ornithinimicrobium sp. TaxID=1977084 RepID=UPI002B4A4581|nr:glutamine-hydrolyzing GMP synthase [Ornithinimicrobium sp.]HKJ12846.1 glutamine-hydrolyzing GMP synthase [Ornithinimicrobium sp.]